MIAVVASTFPRFAGDSEPGFILDFAREVSRFDKVKVFVPNHPLADDSTDWAGVPVERFRYFPLRNQETLCGDGGIPANLTTWKGKVLLPFLILAELALFLRLSRDPEVRVIHVHWLLPQGLAFAFARACLPRYQRAPKTILSLHSGRDASVSRFYLFLEKHIFRSFDRVTVNNEKTRNALQEIYRRPIGYLSMGLPKDAEALALPTQKNYRMIASIGRLVPVKGYLELLRAWAERKDALTGYSLVLLGKGSQANEIQDFIGTQGLAGQVRLCLNPSRELIFQTLSEAGYYLQPSIVTPSGQSEGFGLSAVEALHLGCTAIVTGLGGLAEVVGDVGYVCSQAGEMLDRLVDGRIRPVDPCRCRDRARRFSWGSKSLQELYA